MKKFVLEGEYQKFLTSLGIHVGEALRRADLPEDTFGHHQASLSEKEYFDFMEALSAQITSPAMIVKIGSAENVERFSPPIFAAYCSRNGLIFLKRLARYKQLVGPLRFTVTEEGTRVWVEISTENAWLTVPSFLVATEFVFMIHLIRRATKENICPLAIEMTEPPQEDRESALRDFWQQQPQKSSRNRIAFAAASLKIPFISRNDGMWEYFEPELRRRLTEMKANDDIGTRVRSALVELLPAGESAIDDVARSLGMGKRTLQRRLIAESTTFQQELSEVRKQLACHYMKDESMTTEKIAYLLGYKEWNSFLRAFKIWTGFSVTEYKADAALTRR